MSLSEMIMKNDENLGNSFEAEEEVKQDEKQIEQNFVDNLIFILWPFDVAQSKRNPNYYF